MEYLSIIYNWLESSFKPVLVLAASIFTIFFSWKKIGYRVNVTYTIKSESSSHQRIDNIIFQNKKDKPINIYKVFAVFDKTYCLEIEKFSTPLVLKPYESIHIQTKEFSHLTIESDRYCPNFWNVNIYIESDEKIIKCKTKLHESIDISYIKVTKNVKTFNGLVYNDKVTYILVYSVNSTQKTAFIYDSGFICQEWSFHYNGIQHKNEKIEANEIISFLEQNYATAITSYQLYKINNQTLNFDLIKNHRF